MSVWISDEKLLIFASLISPSKKILFEKKYQTFDAVFHHQMKHLEVRQKYSAARRISTLFSVFHLVMKHLVSCLIYYLKNCLKVHFFFLLEKAYALRICVVPCYHWSFFFYPEWRSGTVNRDRDHTMREVMVYKRFKNTRKLKKPSGQKVVVVA